MPNDDGILKKKKKKREKIPFKKFNKFFNNVFKQQMYLEKCTSIKLFTDSNYIHHLIP